MKCFKCGKEMILGFIPTPAIEWIPEGGKKKLVYDRNSKESGFRVGKFNNFNMKEQSAWYCPNCDLLMIDCKDIYN